MRGSVLILEDELLVAAALAGAVSDAGYDVVGPVATVDDAQRLINDQGIDAALLDVRLKGDDRSFELAARLQAMRIPFAFVTAYPLALLPVAFQETPHLVKPVSHDDVVRLLAGLFGC